MTETDNNIALIQTIADLQKRQELLEEELRLKEQLLANYERSEERTAHLKMVLRAIRNVNQLIVKETDPRKLIERATQTLTETLGYYSAWIALVKNDDNTLGSSAYTGFAEGFEPSCTQFAQGKFSDCMKKALESDITIIVESPAGDCSNCPIRPEYEGRVALTRSLSFDGRAYGILTVSVPAAYAHDPEEQSLFSEVAEDLGFALHKIESAHVLRESKELYHVLYECTQNPILVANQDGIYVDANNAALNFLETTRDQFLGKTVWDYTPKDVLEKQKSECASFLEPRTLETEYEVNGLIKTLLLNVVPVKRGLQTLLFGIGQDITEHKRAEGMLRESELLYRSTLNASPDGIVITDMEGRINMVSPSAVTMFGYKDELELQGQFATNFLALEDRERAQSGIAFMCHGDTRGAVEYSGLRADGTRFDIEANCDFIYDAAGQIIGRVFIIRDVTKRKHAEASFRETSMKLEAIVKAGRIGLWEYDFITNKAFYSPEYKNLIGYREEEISDSIDEWQNRVHPDDKKNVTDPVYHHIESNHTEYDSEYRLRHKDGSYRWVLVRASIVRDREGNPAKLLGALVDITQRKEAEISLTETTTKLETTIKVGQIGLWNFDLKAKKFIYSPECMSQIGLDKTEIIDDPVAWQSLVHPDDLAKNMMTIQDAMTSNKTSFTTELRMRHTDGTYRWLFSQCTVVRDEKGLPIRVLGSQMDITDRKRADEALRESERNYREIFNASGEAIFLIDNATLSMLDVNNAALNLFGYETKKEMMARQIWDLMVTNEPPYTQEEALRLRDAVMQGHQLFDWLGVKKNGERFWVEVSIRITQIGSEGRILVVIRDITERKRAEAERERLIAAIEQAGEVIMITDPEGAIQYTNPAFERITGYQRNEVIGKNPRILKSGNHDNQYYASVWETIKEGHTWEGRFVNKRKDGRLYTEEASISPVRNASGAIVNYVAVQRDISQELETERQLLQAQKMESVGRLAGGVAHDFNNMLVAIIGYAEMSRHELPPDSRVRRWIDEIINASHRSANLTRQLLAFARQQQISPIVLDMNDVVSNMIKLLQRLIGENIDLAWIPGGKLWPVKFDPSQIDQILANLCVNARDAITGSGNVTIKTENVTIENCCCTCRVEGVTGHYQTNVTAEDSKCDHHSEAAPGEYVVLHVSDDGCGMDQGVIAHIFEPFFTTKGMGEGTGLGLSTVYGIVKQNNGFIDVVSEPGKGTTFKIYIPRFVGDVVNKANPKARSAPVGKGETILLVEDEQSVRTACRLFLEDLGYKVLEASKPTACLEMVERYSGDIHLLLTDVIMPEMDGRQLANLLCSVRPNLKVLFMSGYTANVIAEHGILEDGVHLIIKPFSRDDLGRKVLEVLKTE